MSDTRILKTLAVTLDFEATKRELAITDQDIRDALLRASGEKEIPLEVKPVGPGLLTIYVDGASRGNPGPAGAGMVVTRNEKLIESQCQYLERTTNNQAEYRALIMALQRALDLGATEVEIRSDSELMVKQLNGVYRVKNPGLKPLFSEARGLIAKLGAFRIMHIPREKNTQADAMANRAIDEFA